jgi:hypothetical protein
MLRKKHTDTPCGHWSILLEGCHKHGRAGKPEIENSCVVDAALLLSTCAKNLHATAVFTFDVWFEGHAQAF